MVEHGPHSGRSIFSTRLFRLQIGVYLYNHLELEGQSPVSTSASFSWKPVLMRGDRGVPGVHVRLFV